jgi:serine/threonine protein kinase/Tol biopolymer transport system component
MVLAAGARLGPYEVVAPLGAGGMGEVYLARDTRLAREVAIKVLSPHLAETPEARARFEREARAVSSLNHPHICALYDVGRENGVDFLVLEKIEGETVAARLARGPLPADQVLRLGIQIADALDRAHRSGLVHRDLKPGNVMIAKSGAKLMDFGLALPTTLTDPVGSQSLARTMSPSEAQPVTAKGIVVGTFQYMAPELLEGKEADARSDLWALGCVLYEMATGKRAFEGKSQASLISAIMSSEPPRLSQLAPLAPPSLDRLVLACLAKDRDERIQNAHDLKLQLQWIAEGGAQSSALVSTRPAWRTNVGLLGAAAGLIGLSILGTLGLHRSSGDREPVRFLVGIPPGQLSMGGPRLSPDGRTLAFVASDSSGESRIWLRPMGSLESRPIPGTQNAAPPIWSPDHKSVAFVSNGRLQRVPVAGGAVVTLADVGDGRGDGSWSASGWILLDGSRGDSLIAIPAAGGAARPASRLDRTRGDQNHASPRFLPDGRHFIYMAYRLQHGQYTPAIMLGELGSFETKELGPCTSDVDFVPPNRVLYTTGSSLVAQTLDIGRGALTGDAVPVAEGLPPDTPYLFGAGGNSLAVTNSSGTTSELVWLDRAGHLLSRVGEPNRYRDIALSPDARSAALAISDPVTGMDDVWVRDLERGISTRLTFDRTQETGPVWSADGTRIFYSSDRQGGTYIIYSVSASGTGSEDTLSFGNSGNEGPMSASSDGKSLVIISTKGTTWDWDVMIRDVDGKQPPRRFCGSPSLEFDGILSPDDRWLAYSSDETGRQEVYVRSFPDGLRKWRVSSNGGSASAWSKNGRELIYQNLTNDLIAVPMAPGADFKPGKPALLFHADVTQFGWSVHRWAVTSDGERFLVNQSLKNPLRGFTVTRNWQSALAPGR